MIVQAIIAWSLVFQIMLPRQITMKTTIMFITLDSEFSFSGDSAPLYPTFYICKSKLLIIQIISSIAYFYHSVNKNQIGCDSPYKSSWA